MGRKENGEGDRRIIKLGRKLIIDNERVQGFKTQELAILSTVINRLSKIKAKHCTLSLDLGRMLTALKLFSAEQKSQSRYLREEWEIKTYGWQM